ncbi:MAG: hypothetical protein K2X32_09365 [Phycisphaerales bacterium]|nr:hypothetical protein [Phycisphaerales bacterium]
MQTRAIASLAVAALLGACAVANAETITIRSGQVAGSPGIAGQSDDTVTYLPNNPGGAPISAFAFTPADFAGAVSGPAAVVINPVGVWTPGISDTAARWINFGMYQNTSGFGLSGSSLYAIQFNVTTPGATFAQLNLELAVDDSAGDLVFGGANPDFLYVNGTPILSSTTANFAVPTFYNPVIPVNTGLNTLYLYQRDQGLGVSGIIFSATITIPTPGAAAVLGLGGLLATRRRR